MAYSCLLNGLRLGTSWFKLNIVYEGRVSLGLTLELTLPFTTLEDGGSSVQKKNMGTYYNIELAKGTIKSCWSRFTTGWVCDHLRKTRAIQAYHAAAILNLKQGWTGINKIFECILKTASAFVTVKHL